MEKIRIIIYFSDDCDGYGDMGDLQFEGHDDAEEVYYTLKSFISKGIVPRIGEIVFGDDQYKVTEIFYSKNLIQIKFKQD